MAEIDREKVIKGLECHQSSYCVDCPYRKGWATCNAAETLFVDAIALLKEQETQSVLSNRVCEVEPTKYIRKGFCPRCHQEMEWLFNRKHCGFCGQAVKWE